jgi:hypothetical protein
MRSIDLGQYFRAVCPQRKEYISLPSGMKVIERLTSAESMVRLAFLLYDHDAPDDYYDHYGRWAGSDARLVGDYDDSGLYNEPDPTVTVAPLSNPKLIKEDTESTTAPNRHSVTENWTVTLDYARSPLIKGSWSWRGPGSFSCSHPGPKHPDSTFTVGSYVQLRDNDDDRLEEDTVGVVMSIENDWMDITDRVENEMEALVDSELYEQDDAKLMPRRIIGEA